MTWNTKGIEVGDTVRYVHPTDGFVSTETVDFVESDDYTGNAQVGLDRGGWTNSDNLRIISKATGAMVHDVLGDIDTKITTLTEQMRELEAQIATLKAAKRILG